MNQQCWDVGTGLLVSVAHCSVPGMVLAALSIFLPYNARKWLRAWHANDSSNRLLDVASFWLIGLISSVYKSCLTRWPWGYRMVLGSF